MTLEQAAEGLRQALKAYDQADAERKAADEACMAAERRRRAASHAISDARDNLMRIAAGVGDMPNVVPVVSADPEAGAEAS